MEKEKQLLVFLNDDNFEEYRIIKKPDDTLMIYATSTINGKISEKNISEAINKFPRQNVTCTVENNKIVCLKQEVRKKI